MTGMEMLNFANRKIKISCHLFYDNTKHERGKKMALSYAVMVAKTVNIFENNLVICIRV